MKCEKQNDAVEEKQKQLITEHTIVTSIRVTKCLVHLVIYFSNCCLKKMGPAFNKPKTVNTTN